MEANSVTVFAKPSANVQRGAVTDKGSVGRKSVAVGDVLLRRFLLVEQVGSGGTSVVFRARDLLGVLGDYVPEEDLALKIISLPAGTKGVDGVDLLIREALATRGLCHPNILRVYDFHREGDCLFVAMELVIGESLAEHVSRYPERQLPYKKMANIVAGVVDGLAEAHSKGIVHSDIKPANILLDKKRGVKIIDFAASRCRHGAYRKAHKVKPSSQGGFHGYTPAYASPALLADEPPHNSDDIYSLACVIFELLTGDKANVTEAASGPHYKSEVTNVSLVEGDSQLRQSAVVKPNHTTSDRVMPRSLSFAQRAILNRALDKNHYRKFRSIGQFWTLFHWARLINVKSIVSVFLLLVLIVSASVAWQYPDSEKEQSTTSELSTRPFSMRDIVMLESMPVDLRIKEMQKLTASGTTTESMFQLKMGVAKDLWAEWNLVIQRPFTEFNDKDVHMLANSLDLASELYPRDEEIMELKRAVAVERNQVWEYLTLQYEQAWQDGGITIAKALALKSVIEGINSFDKGAEYLQQDIYATGFIESLVQSHQTSNFKRFADLYLSAKALEVHPKVDLRDLQLDSRIYDAAEILADEGVLYSRDINLAALEKWVISVLGVNSNNHLDELTLLLSLVATTEAFDARFSDVRSEQLFIRTLELLKQNLLRLSEVAEMLTASDQADIANALQRIEGLSMSPNLAKAG